MFTIIIRPKCKEPTCRTQNSFSMKEKKKTKTSQTSKTNSENEKNKLLTQFDDSVCRTSKLINDETERVDKNQIRWGNAKMAVCLTYVLEEMHEGFKVYAKSFGQEYIKTHQKRLKKIHDKILGATVQFRLKFAQKMTDLKKSHLLHICCMGDDKDFGCDYDKVEKAYIGLVSEMVHLVDDFYDTFIKE